MDFIRVSHWFPLFELEGSGGNSGYSGTVCKLSNCGRFCLYNVN